MSKRLQVLFDDSEYREIERLARKQGVTVSALVREALRLLRGRMPVQDSERKLAAIRQGARHSFPTGPIAEMLRDIERGYMTESGS